MCEVHPVSNVPTEKHGKGIRKQKHSVQQSQIQTAIFTIYKEHNTLTLQLPSQVDINPFLPAGVQSVVQGMNVPHGYTEGNA